MVIEDDRTQEQKETLRFGVVGTDSFMSGWGMAQDGASYAAWACNGNQIDACERMVRGRREMKRVRVVDLRDYRPDPNLCAHFHIYVYRAP